MTSTDVITIRKPDCEINRFIRGLLFNPVTIFVIFFTGLYVVFVGTGLYGHYSFMTQLAINFVWAGIYYIYMLMAAPRAFILMIDRKIPFFYGYMVFLSIPCLLENVTGAFLFGLSSDPIIIFSNTIQTVLFMAPGLALLLALLQKKFEAGVFFVAPKKYLWFKWVDREAPGQYNSTKEPIRLEALNQYCTIFRENEEPEVERISLSKAIEKYCFKMEGMRVHRSHWIAFDQLHDVKYINGNSRAVLKNGDIIPISRAAFGSLKYRCEAQEFAQDA